MTRYRMDNGSIIDTSLAKASWEEERDWDGRNHVSRQTGSQWEHQTLYKSRKGRYYIEHTSNWQGSKPSVEWISNERAAEWLLLNDDTLPEDLQDLEDELVE